MSEEFDPLNQTVSDATYELQPELTWIPATLRAIVPDSGQFGESLRWEFVTDDELGKGNGDEGQDRAALRWTGQKLTTNDSILRTFVKGLLGRDPAKGEMVDLRQFVGKRVAIMFEHYEKDGQQRDRIIRVKALEE